MNAWLKVLAVSSALALGGGYVWWSQQKSANHRKELESRSVLPGSKSRVIVDEPQPLDGNVPPFDEVRDVATPAHPRTNADFISPAFEEGESRTILPGSKSGLVLPPESSEKKPGKRTVLPGSKSLGPILSPEDTNEEP
jgi:hypothetical protein